MTLLLLLLISCKKNLHNQNKSAFEKHFGYKAPNGRDTIDRFTSAKSNILNLVNDFPNIEDRDGYNNIAIYNLLEALLNRNIEALKILNKEVDYRLVGFGGGLDILHLAVYLGYKDESIYLLNKAKELGEKSFREFHRYVDMLVSVNDKNDDRLAILEKMIELNPNILNEKNTITGHNALMFTTVSDNIELFKFIQNHESFKLKLKDYDKEDMSIISYVGMFGSVDIYKYLFNEEDQNRTDSVKYNGSLGKVDINMQDKYGRTMIMLACANDKKMLFDILMAKDDLDLSLRTKVNVSIIEYVTFKSFREDCVKEDMIYQVIEKVYKGDDKYKRDKYEINLGFELIVSWCKDEKLIKDLLNLNELYESSVKQGKSIDALQAEEKAKDLD